MSDDPLASLATGVAVATGAFSIDRDKAREKLRHFQLADPCAWLLEAVRAAVVVGASAVEVEIDSDDVHVRFIDGTPFSREDVDEIYAALLAKNAPPARQHLAVALNAAMALGPRFVKLTTGPTEGVVLEMRPNQSDTITPFAARGTQRVNATTHIHVRQPFRAGAFVELLKSMTGTKREIQALRRSCADLDIPVVINGSALKRHAPSAEEYDLGVGRGARRDTPAGSIYGWVRLDRYRAEKRSNASDASDGAASGGRVHVLHRGVLLEVLSHELLPDHITAVVEPVGLARDVSLNAFRRDAEFTTMLDAVIAKALEVSESYACGDMRKASDNATAAALTRVAVRAYGDAILDVDRMRFGFDGLHNTAKALLKRDRPLRNAPLFVDVRGSTVSLNALSAEIAKRERVLVSTRLPHETITPDLLIVYAGSDERLALVKHVLGDRMEDAEPFLKSMEERARQRARFASRRGPTTLPPDRWLGRRSGEGRSTFAQGVRFDLGMRSHGPAGLATTIFVDGCLACTKVLPCPFTGLSLAIEGRFALNDVCDDIIVDEAFIRALREAWQEIPALLADAVATELALETPSIHRSALVDHTIVLLGWALDAEGLWRTFVKNVADAAKVMGTPLLLLTFLDLPPMKLSGKDAHVVTRLPILRRVDGAAASMAELPRPIPVVPWEVTRCSTAGAIRSSPTLRTVLEKVSALDVLDARARRENRLAQLKETQPALQMPRDGHAFTLQDGTARGVLRLGTAPGLLVEVRVDGRELAVLPLAYVPIGPLHAVIEDPDVMPLEDGSIPLEDRRRYAIACLRELPKCLWDSHAAPRDAARTRLLVLTLSGLLFPLPSLRRAADVLDMVEYLALLELALTHRLSDVGATVELVMEAGERPTISAVARFAQDAGASLEERPEQPTPPALDGMSGGAWAFEQRVAPFGGRESLLQAVASLAKEQKSVRVADVLFACAPVLAELAFRTLDMRKLTARDLTVVEGPIRFVEREIPAGEEGDGVLVLSPEERTAVANVIGIGRLVDVTEELRMSAARRLFEDKQVERAKLDIGSYPLVGDIHDGKVIGQVGMVPLRTHAATTASVRVLRGGRTVVRQDLSSGAPCSFAAVIDDPDLRMNADFTAPAAPGDMARLFSMCIATAERLVVTAADLFEKHGRDDERRIVLERLARTSQSTLTLKAKRGLASTKIFDTVARDSATPDELDDPPRASVFDAKAAVVDGQLFYVEKRPKKRQSMNLVLVLPTSTERSLAADAIGAKLVDISGQWDREDQLRVVRASLPPLPTPSEGALVTVKAVVGRSTIVAWVMSSPRAPVVHGGHDGLLVRTVGIDVPLPSFTAVLSGPDVIDREWRNVNMESARSELENAAIELGHALLTRVEQQSLVEETDEAIRVLRAGRALICALALKRVRLDARWSLLVGKAMAARVFAVAGGAHISLEHALDERPPSLERFLHDEGFPPAARLVEAHADAVLASMRDDLERLPRVPKPVLDVHPPPPPPPPSPEIELSSRIAETMSLVKLERDAEVELARWPVVVRKNGNKKGLVTFDKKATVVDADHPLASAALAEDADPAALFMLSAVVYGAINAHLGEVTDDHERAFLARLIEHARTVRQA